MNAALESSAMRIDARPPRGAAADGAAPLAAGPASAAPVGRGLHRLACLHVFATSCLIAFGASVTSNDAGLAVPDWPATYGHLNPLAPYLRGLVSGLIALEHNHRVFAMGVGLLTIVLLVAILRQPAASEVRRLAWGLLFGVCVQGAFGGLTVLWKLPAAVSILHGMVAQAFFCGTIVVAYRLSGEWRERARDSADALSPESVAIRGAARWFVAVCAVQLFFGALVRHTVAKERVPTFGDLPVVLHMAFALAVLAALGNLTARTMAASQVDARLRRTVLTVAAAVMVQLLLGLLAVATRTDPLVTVLHVVTGAAILGAASLAALRSDRLAVREGASGDLAAGGTP
jgi:cytochrome c oxidase assembly protein subunit 15